MFRLTSWSSNQDEISSVIGSPAKIFSLGKWSGLCVQGYFWGAPGDGNPNHVRSWEDSASRNVLGVVTLSRR